MKYTITKTRIMAKYTRILKSINKSFNISKCRSNDKFGITCIWGELKAFLPGNIILVKYKVRELINMLRANPIAKLFVFKVVTKNEYNKENSTATITAASIPANALP
jgi:hypothetical protein